MVKSNLARATIDGLRQRIGVAEEGKRRILDVRRRLDLRFENREITREDYLFECGQDIDGRTIAEWLKYYNSYIAYCEGEIRKYGKDIVSNKISLVFFSLVAIFALLFSIVSIGPAFVGLVVQDVENASDSEIVEGALDISEEILDETILEEDGIDIIEGVADENVSEEEIVEGNVSDDILDETILEEDGINITEGVADENVSEEEIVEGNVSDDILDETILEEDGINITEGVADENVSEEEIVEGNVSEEGAVLGEVNISTLQYKAIINRPTKWIKVVEMSELNQSINLTVDIPGEAVNISVKTGEEVLEALNELENYNVTVEKMDRGDIVTGLITGNVALDIKRGEGLFLRFWNWLKSFTITGNVILEEDLIEDIIEVGGKKEIDLENIVNRTRSKNVAIEYYTSGPVSNEINIPGGKRVVISGDDSLNYTEILSFTEIEEKFDVGQESRIKIYWREQKEYVNFIAYDLDGNGKLDYVEWITPHLSNQTFDIILIVKAEHLDPDRNLISDIYEEVRELDGNWSEGISDGDYVRVTFEVALDSSRDITVYPRTVSGNPRIEIYEVDGAELIAEFSSLNDDEYNKVYLTGLVGEQDVFDLRVVGGSIELDYIVDPASAYNLSFISPTPDNGSTTTNPFVEVNLSLTNASDLDEFIYNWNGTNYSMFDDSLLLIMNFDNVSTLGENSSLVKDVSKHGHDGTFVGTPTIVDGKYGKGIDFDADIDYISIPDNDMFTLSNDYSVEAWINPDVNTGWSAFMGTYHGSGGFIFTLKNNEINELTLWAGGTFVYSGYEIKEDGLWKHVAYTRTGTDGRFYVDGVNVANVTATAGTDGGELQIGAGGTGWPAQRFDGTIDEPRIYNRTLSADEVASYYSSNFKKYDTDKWELYVNQPVEELYLTNNTYTYQAFAKDNASNWNQTEERTVTVLPFAPQINFISPTLDNGFTTTNPFVEVNVSVKNASDLDEFIYNWNGTNYTLFNDSLLFMMNFDNVSALGENSSLVKDVSKHGHEGTFVGTPTIVDGKYGKGIDFDADIDYISIPDNTMFTLSNDYSMEAWINPDVNAGWSAFMGTWDGSGGFIFTLRNNAINELSFWAGTFVYSGYEIKEDGLWKHVAYTRTGTDGRFYVDGVNVANVTATAGTDGGELQIGAGGTSWSTLRFDGTIDEPRIYNRTLSADQVALHYSSNLKKYDFDKWELYVNESVEELYLTNNTYTYQAFAKDKSNNWNQTEERTVTVLPFAPQINFISPTLDNGFTTTNPFVEVNVSVKNASDLDEFIYNWNGTNYTLFNDSLLFMMNFDNVSTLGENSSLVKDVSGYGHQGTFVDAPRIVDGKYGKGIDFDASSEYISIPDDPMFTLSNDYSVEAWINPDTNTSLRAFMGTYTGVDGFIFTLENNGIINELSFWAGAWKYAGTNGTISMDGTWKHVVYTRTGVTGTFYIDGVNISTVVGTAGTDGGALQIGSGGTSWIFQKFDGRIDEPRIYNRTLSADEVALHYSSNLKKYDTDKWELYVNQTKNATAGLDDGIYTYQAFAKDEAGNLNYTGERTVNVSSTSAADYAPVIYDVWNESMTDMSSGPTEDSADYVIINFSVSDDNGFGDLNDSSALINFTFGGEYRAAACSRYESSGNYANYTCNVTMWWFDAAGTWSINASIEDDNSNLAINSTDNFYLGSTVGFSSSPAGLSWASISPGATNVEPSDYILMNNTGNYVGNVEVNATNLLGESNPPQALWAANFSVHTSAGCGGTAMVANTYTTIAGASLSVGNYTLSDGTGQEEIYVCLEAANSVLDAQDYSTDASGSWTVRIFMVFLSIKKRKKKEKKLVKKLDGVIECIREENFVSGEELTRLLLERVKHQYSKNREILIPLNIFLKNLGALEALTKYMKENLDMKYSEIGRLLARDERTIWSSYNKAKDKLGVEFVVGTEDEVIPLSEFGKDELTILERTVVYLKQDRGKKYSEISEIIGRDQRNIWTTYSKANKKLA